MSLYLLKILELTPFFYNGGSDPKNVKLNEKVAMGAVLLRHLQNLPCNAHEISELEVQPLTGGGSNGGGKDATSSIVHETGAAAFGTLSLLNHSCDPNVVRHYYSQVISATTNSLDKIRIEKPIMKSNMSAYSHYITELTALFGQLEPLKREKN